MLHTVLSSVDGFFTRTYYNYQDIRVEMPLFPVSFYVVTHQSSHSNYDNNTMKSWPRAILECYVQLRNEYHRYTGVVMTVLVWFGCRTNNLGQSSTGSAKPRH